jgi:RNase H-fold protein (predicted Holliday junction resolvase)
MSNVVIAVDPGREKCGVAVVDGQQGPREQKIVSVGELADVVEQWEKKYQSRVVVIGDRTYSKQTQKLLQAICLEDGKLQIIAVDEHHSSEEARRRYWREHPPQGLKRLIPVTLQMPPRPIDDYVAVILAERYFAQIKNF